ncbi:hypothetical protein SISNIDRAFT_448495 [Sistotremastrum niveocremeum HHB9708]|uniref:Transmembrane protein n=1 Tax=Sistotremastrum niveocremeum HHB9708 TaxID=1314777 RepID=A0A164ZZV6_9AGAM|nr:hypothetical protein SISNIDRAFT_448495 [Sistotremastrum niveocremeum HHB9708]
MPTYNVTAQDVSPLIAYSAGWVDSNHGDALWANYSGGTFHATQSPGASAEITFFGTAYWVFGAKRGNHGSFTVTLNNTDQFTGSGFSANDEFQTLLHSNTTLPIGTHVLTIANGNDPTKFVDIDWITFTGGDGNPSSAGVTTTLDDATSNFTYLPSTDAWPSQTNNGLAPQYFNSTLHATNEHDAQALVSFEGDAIYLYGATSGNHGTFSVQIDDGPIYNLNGSAPAFRPRTLLWYQGGLKPGAHNLTMTNTGTSLLANNYMDVDYVVTESFASPPATSSQGSKAKTPIIAGVVSGVGILLIWIIAGLIFWSKRKKRRSRFAMEEGRAFHSNVPPPDPVIIPPDPAVVDGSCPPGPLRSNSTPTPNFAIGRDGKRRPDMGRALTTPGTFNEVASSHNPTLSDDEAPGPLPSTPPTLPAAKKVRKPLQLHSPLGSTDQPSPTTPLLNQGSNTGQSITSPILNSPSNSQLGAPIREQDWGPVEMATLPPDYQQATERRNPAVNH